MSQITKTQFDKHLVRALSIRDMKPHLKYLNFYEYNNGSYACHLLNGRTIMDLEDLVDNNLVKVYSVRAI